MNKNAYFFASFESCRFGGSFWPILRGSFVYSAMFCGASGAGTAPAGKLAEKDDVVETIAGEASRPDCTDPALMYGTLKVA